MSEVKRYYVGHNPKVLGGHGLVEMSAGYAAETGFSGLVKGEDFDALQKRLAESEESNAQLRDRRNSIVFLKLRVDVLEGLLAQFVRMFGGGLKSSPLQDLCAEADSALALALPKDEHDASTDLACYFGLTRASWLTLPRVLMEAMPAPWKRNMALLLNQYDDTYDNQPGYGTTVRVTVGGKIVPTPEWLINYRHPNHAMIDQVRGLAVEDRCDDE